MHNYEYLVPQSIDEALLIIEEQKESAKVLAGGTDLLLRLKDGKVLANSLLDISKLGLEYIEENANEVKIGSMTLLSQISRYEGVKEPLKVLSESAKEVGAVQTRNMGTVGGNICTGNTCADMGLALLLLNARIKLISKVDERFVPITEFFISPRKCNINSNEILKEIIVDLPEKNDLWGSSFIKIGKRKAVRISIVGAGAVVNIDPVSKIIKDIRIAMSTVAPIPVRLNKAEKFLSGKIFSENLLEEALTVLESEIKPRTSLRATKEYRISLAKALFKRTVNTAIERALEGVEEKC